MNMNIKTKIFKIIMLLFNFDIIQYLTTSFLWLDYDGQSSANVYLIASYARKTCGLCGSFDGDGSNDMEMPNGQMVNSFSY